MTLYWCALLGAVFVGLAGQILLKYGAAEADFVAQLFKPATIAGMAAYGGAALLYIVALRRIPMSVALPARHRARWPKHRLRPKTKP